MNKKRLFMILGICGILAAAFILGATGAIDLNKEQEMKPEDRLIGMIVTTEPVWGQPVIKSGNIDFGPNEGVPAEKKEKTSSDRSIPEEYDYVFPGVEGVRLFNVDTPPFADGHTQVDTSAADEEFSRIGVEFSHNDNRENGQKITETINGINGTLYYVLQDDSVTFFAAPIIQTAEGKVYLGDSGGGIVLSQDQMKYSGTTTLSKSDSHSHTENGEKIVEGRSIKAKIQLVYEPVKITLCQYNAARELIQADEYLPGEMPRDITPLRDTVLIVVDTENKTDEEDAKHTYQAISRADTSFYTLQYKGNGYCIEHYHTLKWPDPYLAEDLSWKIEDLTLTVSGHGRMDDYSYINNAPWKKLTYTRLVVEEGITYLGNHSFSDKPDLKEIILPESLTEIGSNAFQNCDGLIEITLPGNVKDIGTYAFADCSRLKKVNLPDTVKMVNTCAFDNCVCLEYINLPASVRNLGMKVFRNCGSLKSITVAENSRAKWHCIEYNLPYDFSDGTPIHLPEGNTSITWKVENDTLFISGTGDMDDYRERYTEGDAENPDGRYSVNTPWD
ncbi:MAG: leucine-rich repeat domain-containing protein, partial [Clostridia bacterium]|nr:leucine-rich repeat domain-containing protein [Clostridia bacterium]